MRVNRTGPLLEEKIKRISTLKKIIFQLRRSGKKIVFTNGCFDLLHYGHARYLEEAKRKGDILVVGVNSDSSVRMIKGNKRPLLNQKNRMKLVAALGSVDYVVAFGEATPIKVIRELKPDVLVKGADWSKNNIVGSNFVKSYGGSVFIIKLVKDLSTTNLIKKIARLFHTQDN
jgi:D-beta-D-heptose 7-phosphate kinase/D-beta-D-heptose 1-phosphate adenosyltransferase